MESSGEHDLLSSQISSGAADSVDSISQGSTKSYFGFETSSQDSGKNENRSNLGEDINIAPSQESPFLIPSRQVSTPYWKNQPRLKRKCEGFGTPTYIKKLKILTESPLNYSSNGTEEFSAFNSLEEHTYATKLSPGFMEDRKSTSSKNCHPEGQSSKKFHLKLPPPLCTVVVEKEQVVSISIELPTLVEALHKTSSSSGHLADDSDSSHTEKNDSGPFPLKPLILNTTNSSSANSSITGSSTDPIFFRKPAVDAGEVHGVLKYTSQLKACACSCPCICRAVFNCKFSSLSHNESDHLSSSDISSNYLAHSQPLIKSETDGVTSISDSFENILVAESNPFNKVITKSVKNRGRQEMDELGQDTVTESSSDSVDSSSRSVTPVPTNENQEVGPTSSWPYSPSCPRGCKYENDLLVFAKLATDKKFFPAVVKNCSYSEWEFSETLDVLFINNFRTYNVTTRNIFPASLMKDEKSLTYKNEFGVYADGKVLASERTHPFGRFPNDTCLTFVIQCQGASDPNFGDIINVPFYRIALTGHCYRKLKKEIGEPLLTPHKFNKNIRHSSLMQILEEKRNRRAQEVAEDINALSINVQNEPESNSRGKSNKPVAPIRKNIGKIVERKRKMRSTSAKCSESKRMNAPGTHKSTYSDLLDLEDQSSEDEDIQQSIAESKGMRPQRAKNPSETCASTSSFSKSRTKRSHGMESSGSDVTGEECTDAKRSRKSKLDIKLLASSSLDKKPNYKKEPIFNRNDVIEDYSDSDCDDDIDDNLNFSSAGGGDIDYEWLTYIETSRKSCGIRFLKSSSLKSQTVMEDDENLIRRCGPIPTEPLFEGYSFIITHGGFNSYYRKINRRMRRKGCSDISTDYEEIFKTPYAFDFVRLRNQLTAGKGYVYSHLLAVPERDLEKTVVISDIICRTANYLLAAALNVPVYCHDIIVESCLMGTPLKTLLKPGLALPFGITSDRTWYNYTVRRKVACLEGYTVIIASTENNIRLRFWAKLVNLAGGNLSFFTPQRKLMGAKLASANVVIVDDFCPSELLDAAVENSTPIASTRYLVDTVIRGSKQKILDPKLSYYRIKSSIISH